MPRPPLWRSAWPLRLVWLAVPLLVGPALADALDERSRPVQVVGSTLAWVLWGAALVAMLVPRSVTLTAVRVIVPGAVVVAAWSAMAGAPGESAAMAIGGGALALLGLADAGVSDAFVDGSSYGAERRAALRVPVLVLVGPVPLAWTAVAAGAVTGPLLLAAERWVAGAVAVLAGVAAVVVGTRQLHLLSRRWLVFVPAGVVVHDPLTLTEPILFPRHLVDHVGPARADSHALDATGGALGLAIEIESREPFTAGLRLGNDRQEHRDVHALLVTPARPATVLAMAADHRLPVR